MIVGIKMVVDSEFFQLRCIYSDLDGNKYCVRERTKLKLAANRLAQVRGNLDKLVAKCKETKSDFFIYSFEESLNSSWMRSPIEVLVSDSISLFLDIFSLMSSFS